MIGDSRSMRELEDESVHLVVTSPPYWQIKDYGEEGQIGHGQTLHDYLKDLSVVWQECGRVLKRGRKLCVNIGDQFARASLFGRYKVIPLHAEVITSCEYLGFDHLGSIIWQKRTRMEPSGGANVMGSYPYPPNGVVEIDYEHILLFRKQGKQERIPPEEREGSELTKEEWKTFHSGHWYFGGARQTGHEAVFPIELPRRLIRMFTLKNEVVLDPFLGSGTTARASIETGRIPVGYEYNPDFIPFIEKKLGAHGKGIEMVRRPGMVRTEKTGYVPHIMDLEPVKSKGEKDERYHRVVKIAGPDRILLDDGREVSFLGVKVTKEDEAISYLGDYLLGKRVMVIEEGDRDRVYVYMKNRIFVNTHLLRSGLGELTDEGFSRRKVFKKYI